MINCAFCGIYFSSIEEYEAHIDTDCSQNETIGATEFIGTQIFCNGKSEFKILSIKPKIGRRKVTPFRTDEEGTVPVNRFCEVFVG